MWNRALLMVVLSASAAFAQQTSAHIEIVVRIPKAGSLSLAPSAGIVASQGSMGRQVQVRLRPSSGTRAVTVPLIARSNAPYRLVVKSATPQDGSNPEPIRIVLRSTDPNAGITHLNAGAMNVHALEGQLVGMIDQTIAEGPRISNGGNDATPDNALRLVFEAELPQSLSEAELTFTMELY